MIRIIVITVTLFFPIQLLAQDIKLINFKNCVEACVVYLADQSGSTDEAHNDICRWVKLATMVPPTDGAVSVGLYSFNEGGREWLYPTSDKRLLENAVDSMCVQVPNGSTKPLSMLRSLLAMFKDRRSRYPFEHQVLLMHSDYFIDDSDDDSTVYEVKQLIAEGVIVVLSVPLIYDSYVPMSPTPPEKSGAYNPHISDAYISLLQSAGAISIRSDFVKYAALLTQLEAKKPCN